MVGQRRRARRSTVALLIVLALVAVWRVTVWVSPLLARDWREWPVYDADDPMTAQLDLTGPELTWDAPRVISGTRLFVSDHPETLGLVVSEPGDTVAKTPEGTLWADEASGARGLAYQVFVSHMNWFNQPLCIGLVVDNRGDTPLTVTGRQVTTLAEPTRDQREGWLRMVAIGQRNAYAELSGKLWEDLPAVTVAPGRRALLHTWELPKLATIGARMKLKLTANGGPVRCRLATTWAWTADRLTADLPLIPRGQHHPRGTWDGAEIELHNSAAPFDVAKTDAGGRTVRALRLCQPVYQGGKKVGYRPDVVYTFERSTNPDQCLPNNGMYGALTRTRLHVTNSGTTPRTVELYLRYPDSRLHGSYVGAARVYARNATTGA